MCNIVQYIGFHGTSAKNAESIVLKGFDFNIPDDKADALLLGRGVYFFIEGISDPKQNAYDYSKNINADVDPAVIKSDISTEKEHILDLNSNEGLKLFNKYKDRFYRKRVTDKKPMSKKVDDGKIINVLIGELFKEISIVISNRAVRLTSDEKDFNLHSYIPNCTFCCVREPGCISNITKVNMED